ncbi:MULTISPECIES: hypothetical protein [Exiguobacterium]|uniref:hypothetical protein n=1 Tax=Exiguobacterium TaxID=33986 RepID=UPI00047C0E5D|nr:MULTISPECIES: hypothetical protein [Exiguobacterium]MDX1259480.1 hypothetical protein [Exiguobacterium sp. K1]RDB33089.1 hypothetical protein DVG79_00060 [Exiguobacterium sp. RIT594]HCN57732.1 hypothetical protein [Exiguobacterium sp.]
MSAMFVSYQLSLEEKFFNMIENKWFWMVFALVLLVGIFAYAFYCTSRGYSFNGNVKLNWPKIWQMGIGCKAS